MFEDLIPDIIDDLCNRLNMNGLCKLGCLSNELDHIASSDKYWVKHFIRYNTNKNLPKNNLKTKTIKQYTKYLKKHPSTQYTFYDEVSLTRLQSLVKGYTLQIKILENRKKNKELLELLV